VAIVIPTNPSVKGLQGLHLYHADMSNCSMRVRMALEEKGLEWTSHHISLQKKENVTAEYFGIHPKGLVPALVHDGVVHIESNDIIGYLDERFPEPPLLPASSAERDEVQGWLKIATDHHLDTVKTYIYAKKMAGKLRKTDEEAAHYRSLQRDPELVEFHAKVASDAGLSATEVADAEARLHGFFARAEETLARHRWLVGDRFSLADIAWAPLHFTLAGAGFPFHEYPRISAWADAVRERPSFQQGVLKWCPKF
jgi:glutathione S-transferase